MDHEGGIIEAWATGVSLEGKVLVEGNTFSARHDDGPADKGADDFENPSFEVETGAFEVEAGAGEPSAAAGSAAADSAAADSAAPAPKNAPSATFEMD